MNPFTAIDMLIDVQFSPRSLIPHENDHGVHVKYPLEYKTPDGPRDPGPEGEPDSGHSKFPAGRR